MHLKFRTVFNSVFSYLAYLNQISMDIQQILMKPYKEKLFESLLMKQNKIIV